jgi:hypothetical protein
MTSFTSRLLGRIITMAADARKGSAAQAQQIEELADKALRVLEPARETGFRCEEGHPLQRFYEGEYAHRLLCPICDAALVADLTARTLHFAVTVVVRKIEDGRLVRDEIQSNLESVDYVENAVVQPIGGEA